MTNQDIMAQLEAAGFPEEKSALAANRVIDKFFDLCAQNNVLTDNDESGQLGQRRGIALTTREYRRILLDQSLQQIIQAGPEKIKLTQLERIVSKIRNRRLN